MKSTPLNKHNTLGQSAVELAVFGSILLFVIGLIVRAGLYQDLAMNAQLRAMRLALTESYVTAHGAYRYGQNAGKPAGARNTAAILLIEDRLSVDSAQALGTRDRIPLITSGGGTLSHNLFWSLDYGNEDDLPIYDMFVNGVRFPFMTARFMSAEISYTNQTITYCYFNDPAASCWTVSIPACTTPPVGAICWMPNCLSSGSPECVLVHTKVYNVPPPAGAEWCDGVDDACPGGAAEAETRFDLNRNGIVTLADGDVPPKLMLPPVILAGSATPTNIELRDVFNWQWKRVALVKDRAVNLNGTLLPGITGVNIEQSINRAVDLDGDNQEENILEMDAPDGRIAIIRYIDYQEGDVDFSDTSGDIGLRNEIQIFSNTKGPVLSGTPLYGGTYMLVEEGKLYGTDGQFIRDTTRQDHVDMISRFFQLSHNTGRFCSPLEVLEVWNDLSDPTPVKGVRGLNNPVEACGHTPAAPPNSFSTCITDPLKVDRTCMDITTNTIYIRSRIEDLRGHRWMTRVLQ